MLLAVLTMLWNAHKDSMLFYCAYFWVPRKAEQDSALAIVINRPHQNKESETEVSPLSALKQKDRPSWTVLIGSTTTFQMAFHALGTTTSGYVHLFICSQCHSATWTKIRALFCWVHIENWFCLNKLKSKQMRQSHSSGTSQRCHLIFPAWAKKAPAELQINLVLPGLMNHGFLYTYAYVYRKDIYKLCLWDQLWAHTWIKVSWVHTVQEALSSGFVRENCDKALTLSTP